MLQTETVEKTTLQLIKRLQSFPLLSSTRLVGGTALSLQIGHRISEDIDLFTNDNIDISTVIDLLTGKTDFIPHTVFERSVIGSIGGVKVDIIYHPYIWISPAVEQENMRIASLDDIVAMKLHAIINSGSRPKDFVDLAYLSQFYSYNTMKELLLKKYPKYDPIMADKAVNYFGDINEEQIPRIKMTKGDMNFRQIRYRLLRMADSPFKIFSNAPLPESRKVSRSR